MATITSLPSASSIDGAADVFPIVTNSINTTQKITRNTFLNLTSQPVGLSDAQTLTSKTLTTPTINGATLSGTLSGTYTIGGTPTFPSTVVQTTTSQVLTNKTLTSPTINSPTITNASISADAVSGYTTANSGTIYGLSITAGQISSALTLTQPLTVPSVTSSGLITASNGLTASGTITLPNSSLKPTVLDNPYKFRVYWAAGQGGYLSSAATPYIIKFDTVSFDTSNAYNTNTFTYTIPVTGLWYFRMSGAANNGSSAGDGWVNAYLQRNGSIISSSQNPCQNAQPNTTAHVGTIYQCTAGDSILAQMACSFSGIGVDGGLDVTYFEGFLISAT